MVRKKLLRSAAVQTCSIVQHVFLYFRNSGDFCDRKQVLTIVVTIGMEMLVTTAYVAVLIQSFPKWRCSAYRGCLSVAISR